VFVRLVAGVPATAGRQAVLVALRDAEQVGGSPPTPGLDAAGNAIVKEAATAGGVQSQATVGVAAATVAAANSSRASLKIKSHPDNTGRVYYRTDAAATVATGFLLEPGEEEIVTTPEAVSMIADAAGQTVFLDEESRAS
jgi:hypothetical protein